MNLQGLSAAGPAFLAGQEQIANLRQKAQQIQQTQFALDQAKKQLQADAAVFTGLGGPQPQGAPPQAMQAPPMTGQPPMPGQASVPAGPAPQMSMSAAAPAAGGGAVPAGPQPPTGAQAGPTPSGAPPMGAPGADPNQFGPEQAYMAVMNIAQQIRARNPGIDPQTLSLAVERVIGFARDLSPFQRQQMQYVIAQDRNATSRENTQDRVSAQRDIASANIGSREKIAAGHDETSRANAQARIADADQRLTFTQAAIDRRAAAGRTGKVQSRVQRDRAALLRTQLSQAKNKLSRLVGAGTYAGPEYDAAQKAVDDSYNRILDFQNKVLGSDTSLGGQLDQSAAPEPQSPTAGAQAPVTATGPNGEKVQLVNGKWVPVPK